MSARVADLIVQVSGLADAQAKSDRLGLIDEYLKESHKVLVAASDLKSAIEGINAVFSSENTTEQKRHLRKLIEEERAFINTLRSSRKRVESDWDQRLRKARETLTRDRDGLTVRWRDLIGITKEKAQALASNGEADGEVLSALARLATAAINGPVKSGSVAVRQDLDLATKFIEKHPGGNELAEWLARVKAGKATVADVLERPAVFNALRSQPTLAKKLKVVE
jgi:hypothetical protein